MTAPLKVSIKMIDETLPVPRYARPGDAGADLPAREDVLIPPGERRMVGTGVALEIPEGWVGLIHPRSGLAARSGLTIVNSPGTIDSGYRGEIKVCLLNTDLTEMIHLHRGDFIAQIVFQEVAQAEFLPVSDLSASARGVGGYGSTGGVGVWDDTATSQIR